MISYGSSGKTGGTQAAKGPGGGGGDLDGS